MRSVPLAAALAAAAALNGLALPRSGPAATTLPALEAETAMQTAGLLAFGKRRLAADIELIRLLVYYGSPESAPPDGHHEHDGHDHRAAEGGYPELGPRARRAFDLDPSFNYAVIFAAGALAFNLNRPQEALDLLAAALERDPGNLQLQAYVGAIAFHRQGDTDAVIRLLEPVLADPQCPTMIKHMVAFMYRRTGRHEKAARLYLEILDTSRDAGYRAAARRALDEIGPAVLRRAGSAER